MAEKRKKQTAVFGTNQPRDENRAFGHDVQRSEQKQKSGKISERQVSTGKRIPLDRETRSLEIRIPVRIRKVIFHRKIMLLLRECFRAGEKPATG